MAIRNILKEGDEALNKISKPVVDFDERLWTLLDDMKDTMYKNEGAGLAAVQVGVLKRLFVMDTGNGLRECINPKILKQDGINKVKIEGCLSVPGKCGYVERPDKVWVEYQDRNGEKQSKKFTGFEAKCFCHESDHLDGILYTSKASKMFNDRNEYGEYEKKKKENND
ncbi:MAG: peptide deformylase [Clostridia bacterium]|nr:peptide deformylase [Clostridia bacterium]